jgi:hypothetical protein
MGDSLDPGANRVLTEENPRTSFVVEQDLINPNLLVYAFAYDEAGRTHVKYYRLGAFVRRYISRWVYDLDYLELPEPHEVSR